MDDILSQLTFRAQALWSTVKSQPLVKKCLGHNISGLGGAGRDGAGVGVRIMIFMS